ncbi:ARM repeat-containing protein [Neoconidiobolus thromboides FSU 785]|nr:ARM repeat-containing protein [Neoconidiobolus thromboides FSU 785]
MELSLKDQTINALKVLYDPRQQSELKSEANTFLLQFQQRLEAWQIADYLLRDPNQGLEVKIFMAQTLKSKIKNDLLDLDSNSVKSLRDSLIEIIEAHQQAPDHLLTQLCLSLALLAIQLKEWQNVVPGLIQLWSNNMANLRSLLLFLTVLPQEINSIYGFKTLSDYEFRDQSDKLLADNSKVVLDILLKIIESEENKNDRVYQKVFDCLQSWLKSGDIAINDLENSYLLDLIFNCLITKPQLFDISCEVICGIIYETRDVDSSKVVIQEINNKISELLNYVKRHELPEDILQGLVRIFSEAGEAYLEIIVKFPELFQHLLEGIVECIKKCPINSLSTTFGFYYSFSQALNDDKYMEKRELFIPFFEATLSAIISRLQLPRNDSDWSLEEMDQFKDFRHEIGYILKDCATVLGVDRALSAPYTILTQQLQYPVDKIYEHWQEIEAVLFALRSLGSEISRRDKIVLDVINVLPNLPPHPKLRRTATLIISNYAEWIALHPNLLPFLLTYCSEGLSDKEIAPAAALSICYLGQFCGKDMTQHLSALVELYKQYESTLEKYDLLELTGAIGFVLKHIPQENYAEALTSIIDPILAKLQTYISNEAQLSSNVEELNFYLDRLCKIIANGLVSFNNNEHPALTYIHQMWNLLEHLLEKYHAHPTISEVLASVFVKIIESLAPHNLPYLSSFSNAIVESFKYSESAVYIWVVRKIFVAYFKTNKYEAFDLVKRTSELTFGIVSRAYHVDRVPQIIEDFCYLLSSIVKRSKSEVFSLPIFETLFEFYYATLDMHESHGLGATFESFILILNTLLAEVNHKKNDEHCQQIVALTSNYGQAIIGRLILNSIEYYSVYELHDACEIIGLLAELNREKIVHWLQLAFLNIKDSPFALPKDPSIPSPALRGLLDQASEKVHYGDFRKFKLKLTRFLKGYRHKNNEEDEERQVRFAQ